MIAKQLNGDAPPTSNMSTEVTLGLAVQLGNDPEIQAAEQRFAARNPDTWQLYAVDRANWPIYSWVWNYTNKINK